MAIDFTALAAYRRSTFDEQLAELEQICLRELPPPLDAIDLLEYARQHGNINAFEPPPESMAWYAREILADIHVVRQLLAAGSVDAAVAGAMRIGILAARAGARFYWREMRGWSACVMHARKASKAAAERRRQNAEREDKELGIEVEEIRRKRPDLSINAIAQLIHDRWVREELIDEDEDDPKRKVAALAKRIARLSREKVPPPREKKSRPEK